MTTRTRDLSNKELILDTLNNQTQFVTSSQLFKAVKRRRRSILNHVVRARLSELVKDGAVASLDVDGPNAPRTYGLTRPKVTEQ